MIVNQGGDLVLTCDSGTCKETLTVLPYGSVAYEQPRYTGSRFGWSNVRDLDFCPECTAARYYRPLQLDRLGPSPYAPSDSPLIVSCDREAVGDPTDMRWVIVMMVVHLERAVRVRSAFKVLYSHSAHVRMWHRSIALGIIDGTGDPLIDKGAI